MQRESQAGGGAGGGAGVGGGDGGGGGEGGGSSEELGGGQGGLGSGKDRSADCITVGSSAVEEPDVVTDEAPPVAALGMLLLIS